MSAFMMPAKTTAIIAQYLARAAGEVGHSGTVQGAKTIEPPKELIKCLKDAGCYDAKYDEYKADKIYEVMCNFNAAALKERYANGSDAVEPFERQPICTREESRREWLSNLFTVARCYLYQCDEGIVRDSDFFKAFGKWVDKMAYLLTEYVVEEYRPKYKQEGQKGEWKSWDMF